MSRHCVAHTEAGKFQNVGVEMLGEDPEVSAIVAPTGHAGAGPVQQDQWLALAGCARFVVAQRPLVGGQFSLGALVCHVHQTRVERVSVSGDAGVR
ncbi:Uncharacterised protein [Mycobacteroides abscessus subsp. abscessus]|nr:Uncharacterised protein [Mycobacteroides abscessus subsp. abscessus]